MRAVPDQNVRNWEEAHGDQLWLSTVVIGEFLSGVALMPDGKRKVVLQAQYQDILAVHHDRVAPFDLAAALRYADVLAFQETAGRNPGTADTQIAATTLARGFSLATRNVKHFAGLGVRLIDPWQA